MYIICAVLMDILYCLYIVLYNYNNLHLHCIIQFVYTCIYIYPGVFIYAHILNREALKGRLV